MAYTQIPVQTLTTAGVALTWTANDTEATGMKFQNDGNTYLGVLNGNEGADAAVVTIISSGTVNGLALANVSKTIAAGDLYQFARLPIDAFNVQSGTDINSVLITITGDAAADVSFALIK